MSKPNVFRRAVNAIIMAQEARARTYVRNCAESNPALKSLIEGETLSR